MNTDAAQRPDTPPETETDRLVALAYRLGYAAGYDAGEREALRQTDPHSLDYAYQT